MIQSNSLPPPGEPVKVADIPTNYPSSTLTNDKNQRLTIPKSSPEKGKEKRNMKERE